ncbi:MAG: hypothetical protein VR73_05240 [Gammaproteobacteria bacterium BRH_c0]|nr:MAG: hypothetical protein VR73_05240 [Gammaproteobacteria bacterium BRH_c0]
MGRWMIVLAVLLVSACAGHRQPLPAAALDTHVLLSGERLAFAAPEPVDDSQWLETDPAMAAFAAEHAAGGNNSDNFVAMISALLRASPGGFSYDATTTLNASQSYQQQRGNCLSLAAMVVAIGRAAGFDTRFQRVDMPPEWNLRHNTAVFNLHINSVALFRHDRVMEVELGGRGVQQDHGRALLTDAEALAEYHNNLGAEALIAGNLPRAYAHLRRALELAPHISHIWSNLAAFYRNQQDDLAAEAAWLQALQHSGEQLPALSGLQRLYQQQGKTALAEQLQSRVAFYRQSNPFYHYMLGYQAFEQGDYAAARREVKLAIARLRDPRFEALLAAIDEQQKVQALLATEESGIGRRQGLME